MSRQPMRTLAPAVALMAVLAAVPATAGSDPYYGEPGVAASEPAWYPQSYSYLGVDTRDVTKERMAALKLKEERGVEITMVDRDAPAGKAGLKVGDVILDFNGQRVESQEQLRRMIREVPPGRTVTLGISRDGQPLSVQATLADRGSQMTMFRVAPSPPPARVRPRVRVAPPAIEFPQFNVVITDRGRTGLVVENLTPQLGEFFGVKDGEGVLVRSVEKGSPAEAAGFRAGDVIVKVGDQRVARLSDWRSALRGRKGTVAVSVIRDKKEHALSLALPQGGPDESSFWIEVPEIEKFEIQVPEAEVRRLGETAAAAARSAYAVSATEIERAVREAQRELERELRRLDEELARESRELERRRLQQKQRELEKQKEKLKIEEQ